MIRYVLFFVLSILLSLGLGDIRAQAQERKGAPDGLSWAMMDEMLQNEDEVEGKSAFIQGLLAFEQNELEKSLDFFNRALIKFPESGGIHFALADVYLNLNDMVNATYFARQAIENEQDNYWYRIKLVEIYQQQGFADQAIQQLDEMSDLFPKDTDILFRMAELYQVMGNLPQANALYMRIIQKLGDDLAARYKRLNNFKVLNQQDSVIVELEALNELMPGDEKVLSSIAQYYAGQGNRAKAEASYLEILRRNPNQVDVLVELGLMYLDVNEYQKVTEFYEPVFESETVPIAKKESLLEFLLERASVNPNQQTFTTYAEQTLDRLKAKYPNRSSWSQLGAKYYLTIGNNEKAIEALKRINELEPRNGQAWQERLRLLATNNRFSEAVEVGVEADKYIPDDVFIHYVVGTGYLVNQDHANAAKWFERAVYLPARRSFKSLLYGSLGDAYHALDQWEEAQQAYESALRADPNNATVLNNYAYYLSLRAGRLNEAKLMSKKSLDIEPLNPSFLDTYGWIIYQLGEKKEALTFLLKAVEQGGTSAEILEHVGEVYESMGEREEAKIWWKKALENEPSRTYLKDKIDAQ